MRGDLQQPRVLNLNHLAHELLRREHQLMVDDPARSVLRQTAVGVDGHSLLVIDGLVLSTLAQPSRVVKEPSGDCLSTACTKRQRVKV